MKNKRLVYPTTAAMITAFLVLCSQICIYLPSGMPITLQTFAVALCGYLLGVKWGTVSVLTYILLGVVGLPVFSSFGGGIGYIIGPTGGFIFGFLIFSTLCGVASNTEKKYLKIIISALGLFLCHLIGTLQFSVVAETSATAAFLSVSLIYIPKDILSAFGAYFIALRLKRIFA